VKKRQKPPARVAAIRRAIEEGLRQETRLLEQPSMGEDEIQLSVPHRPVG